MSATRQPVDSPGKRRRWLPLTVLLVGGVVVAALLLTYSPAPVVPLDDDHRAARVPDRCLACHGSGGPNPRPPDHPIGQACLSCHRWE